VSPIVLGSPPPHPGGFHTLKPKDLPALRGEQRICGPRFIRSAWKWSKEKRGGSSLSEEENIDRWQFAARPSTDGRMFFVEQAMIPLVLARAEKVPGNTPIMAVRRPAEAGMIVFGSPPAVWEHPVAIDGEKYFSPIDAFSWVVDDKRIHAAGFVRGPGSIFDDPGVKRRIGGRVPPWVMLCITQLPDPSEDDYINVLRLLTACWTLMREPRVTETRTVTHYGKKARGLERSIGENPRVTVVNVRPGVRGRPAAPGTGGSGKPLGHLVDVAGHYKTFHVGPGRAERDVRWVSPHTRGPEGAPRSDIIRVLRPDRKEEM
jgi:hypothetical protein